jgi:hypothetical protein
MRENVSPKPRGASISPVEDFATEILDLIAEHPNLTLVETVAELRKGGINTSLALAFSRPARHPASSRTVFGTD